MRYVIGVDGGGTKTAYGLMNETGVIAARHEGPSSNHEGLQGGYDEAAARIAEGINMLCAKAGVDVQQVKQYVFCLAGVDNRTQQAELATRFETAGFAPSIICNDGFAGAMAGFRGRPIVLCNNGTGVCFAGLHPNGNMLQLGGCERFTGDYGGGVQLAVRCFRRVYGQYFLHGMATSMAQPLLELLGCDSHKDMLDAAETLREQAKELVPKIIQLLFSSAASGDEVASAIVSRMQRQLVATVGGMIDHLPIPEREIDIVLSGSIHTRAIPPTYITQLRSMLHETYDKTFDVRILESDPVEGAMAWALGQL